MSISIIVAIAENYAIGKDNKLLWHISEDLKRFKKLTSGHKVIMGRNTFLSLPKGALPGRTNIVITDNPHEKFENCIMVYSIDEAKNLCDKNEEIFIIGGASVYRQFLAFADKLYITWVNKKFEADTFFPEIDENKWEVSDKSEVFYSEKNDFDYFFVTYIRKNN